MVERKWTDFVVMGTGCTTTFCERIHFSQEHWDTTFPKLESFFNCWIVPELAYPCVKYGLPKLNARMFKSTFLIYYKDVTEDLFFNIVNVDYITLFLFFTT